jgi:hypothetical protein
MGWQDRRRLPLRPRDPRGGLIEAPHGQFMHLSVSGLVWLRLRGRLSGRPSSF